MDDARSPTPTPESPGDPPLERGEELPWGQRFFDRPFLLLILGILIMALSFTGWGLWEILTLEPAPLP